MKGTLIFIRITPVKENNNNVLYKMLYHVACVKPYSSEKKGFCFMFVNVQHHNLGPYLHGAINNNHMRFCAATSKMGGSSVCLQLLKTNSHILP